ncbi:rhomboid family intramembrane serine protease [Streptomyces sp. NPDC048361]|uniref:rhomboid family intramembrane serine protease n=1 Tax=Streptomyces sp. NPDC048361 TaxID=3154720 RepID=UPI00341EEC05
MNQDQDEARQSSLPGCYRHPEVHTGIRCVRCDRPICPECMVSASVGFQCPECVRSGSGTGHTPTANRPRTVAGGVLASGDRQLVTKILIGINLAVFLVQQVLGTRVIDEFALLGHAGVPGLDGAQGVADGQWYRLVTSMFLHQGYLHVGFNMLSLWWVGGPLEPALGRARYLALYFVSGLAGGALTYLLAAQNQFSLGASGAIFGLFGAMAVLMRRMKYDMRPVIGLLVVNLIFTFSWSGIAWQAHVGGLVAGVVVGIGMVHAPAERRALAQWGSCAAVFALSLALVLIRTAQLT